MAESIRNIFQDTQDTSIAARNVLVDVPENAVLDHQVSHSQDFLEIDPGKETLVSKTKIKSLVKSMHNPSSLNDRTLYGGYRVNLAHQARELALQVGQGMRDGDVQAGSKQPYQRNWESVFGKHTARCHPKSLIDMVKKEGKLTIFVALLGTLASSLDYAMNLSIYGLENLKQHLIDISTSDTKLLIPIVIAVSFLVALSMFAVIWTRIIDPFAAGSGIPEMKAIISGDLRREPERYLRARTLLAKAVGLVAAVGAGLSVGREGPFVHTASIICHQMMKHIPWFKSIRDNEFMRRLMFNAACAVGVASSFGTPIGGVLFSIEVTSTFFLVSNYWRGFTAAVVGSLVKQFLDNVRDGQFRSFEPLFPTKFEDHSYEMYELFLFGCLGILMGVLGASYILVADRIRLLSYKFNHQSPLIWAFVVALGIGVVAYTPGEFNHLSMPDLLDHLCNPKELDAIWHVYPPVITLFVCAASRILTTSFSTALPVPAGDFIPMFVCGAAFGRCIGEVILLLFPTSSITPGGYALVGGAALVGAITHTISVAVIALEFTGQFVYFLPIFVAVLVANGTSGGLTSSIYDVMLMRKGLPYLPLLRTDEICGLTAKELMNTQLYVLTRECTYKEILEIISSVSFSRIPIVEDKKSMMFLGCIKRVELIALLQTQYSVQLTVDTRASLSKRLRSPKRPSLREMSWVELELGQMSPVDLSSDVEQEKKSISQGLDLMQCQDISIDRSSLRIDVDTPAAQVHLLFEMMKSSMLFVHRFGSLVGVISRRSLYFRLHYLQGITDHLSLPSENEDET